jgi:integrase
MGVSLSLVAENAAKDFLLNLKPEKRRSDQTIGTLSDTSKLTSEKKRSNPSFESDTQTENSRRPGQDLNPRRRLDRREVNEELCAFRSFLEVDQQLSDLTVKGHIREIKRLLKSLGKPAEETTTQELREYLAEFKDANKNTYANVLKSLRVYFRDFKRMDIADTFKFPKRSFQFKRIPSREELQRFYAALENPKERALFLMYATSGLRRSEVASLRSKT